VLACVIAAAGCELFEEARSTSVAACRCCRPVSTSPVATFIAANKSMVPCRDAESVQRASRDKISGQSLK